MCYFTFTNSDISPTFVTGVQSRASRCHNSVTRSHMHSTSASKHTWNMCLAIQCTSVLKQYTGMYYYVSCCAPLIISTKWVKVNKTRYKAGNCVLLH